MTHIPASTVANVLGHPGQEWASSVCPDVQGWHLVASFAVSRTGGPVPLPVSSGDPHMPVFSGTHNPSLHTPSCPSCPERHAPLEGAWRVCVLRSCCVNHSSHLLPPHSTALFARQGGGPGAGLLQGREGGWGSWLQRGGLPAAAASKLPVGHCSGP